jgi:RNA polymerase sigma-70 factor (ECF subfamily)
MPDQSEGSATSVSLLVRLQQAPADQGAWTEFVRRYGTHIRGWCRNWGLQEADAEDVSQDVLMKLVRAIQAFRYDPAQRFRGWLKTVTHHAWQDLARGRRTIAAGASPAAISLLQSAAARDDLAAGIEAAYEQELLDRAQKRVRPRVLPQTWDAFRLTALDGLGGAEVAARLGMPVTSVYKAKSNVQKLLEAEVLVLEGGKM